MEAAISLGADAVGFVFEPCSPRCLPSTDDAGLLAGLPPFVTRVGVFGTAHNNAPFELLDAVQAIEFPFPCDLRSIQVVRLGSAITVAEVLARSGSAPALLLDAHSKQGFGGTGEKVDWGLAAEIVAESHIPVILAGGLTPENVAAAVKMVRPYAVDVSSGVESSPGVKDLEKLRRFLEAARG